MSNPPAPRPNQFLPGANATNLVAWLFFSIMFAPVLTWLVQIWGTSLYDAHGAVVPFLVAGMLFSRKRELAGAPHTPDPTGLALTGAGVLLLLTSLLVGFNMLGGVDPVDAILEFAARHGITQIFAGHSRRTGMLSRFARTPVDRLLENADNIDVRVFPQ